MAEQTPLSQKRKTSIRAEEKIWDYLELPSVSSDELQKKRNQWKQFCAPLEKACQSQLGVDYSPKTHVIETQTTLLSPVTAVFLVVNNEKPFNENAGSFSSTKLFKLISNISTSINYVVSNSKGQASLVHTTPEKGLQYIRIKIQNHEYDVYPAIRRLNSYYFLISCGDDEEYSLVEDDRMLLINDLDTFNESHYGAWEIAKACAMLVADWNSTQPSQQQIPHVFESIVYSVAQPMDASVWNGATFKELLIKILVYLQNILQSPEESDWVTNLSNRQELIQWLENLKNLDNKNILKKLQAYKRPTAVLNQPVRKPPTCLLSPVNKSQPQPPFPSSNENTSLEDASKELKKSFEERIQQLVSPAVPISEVLTDYSRWTELASTLDPPNSFWKQFAGHKFVGKNLQQISRFETTSRFETSSSPSQEIIMEWQHGLYGNAASLLKILVDIGCISGAKLIMQWTEPFVANASSSPSSPSGTPTKHNTYDGVLSKPTEAIAAISPNITKILVKLKIENLVSDGMIQRWGHTDFDKAAELFFYLRDCRSNTKLINAFLTALDENGIFIA
mmetsp:Transcript_28605/g.40328  ORF Transcript_28605/g.40328 Transcript_28605/m.40328 type:complete len:563 (-) Transcript_28605:32-1720(-)